MVDFLNERKWRFFFLVLFSCILSACLRYENIWDLINYHYYSGFAFVTGRVGYDLAPAIHHSYFNPLLDSVTYLLMNALNDYPAVYYFIAGIPFGVALFLLDLIAGLFFDVKTPQGRHAVLGCLIIGATGYGMFFQIGSSTHEITVACFVLTAMYWLLKTVVFDKKVDMRLIVAAGFVLGAAAGLKMSVNLYCVSTGMTLILFYRRFPRPFLTIFLFAVAGLTGWLAFNGFWAYHLWTAYGNPFGVFFNRIFKSPYFSDMNYNKTSFTEGRTFGDLLLMPFYFIRYRPQDMKTEESLFSDFRWATGILLLLATVLYGLYKKKNPMSLPMRFLCVWLAVSYVVWGMTVSVVRYAVPMELLFAVVFVRTFTALPVTLRCVKNVLGCVYLILFVSTVVLSEPHWDGNFGSKIIDAEELDVKDDTLVILMGDPLSAYLVPAAQKAKIRSVTISALRPVSFSFPETGRFAYQRQALLETHRGPRIALVRTDFFTGWVMPQLAYDILNTMRCRPFRQPIKDLDVLLCRE